MKIKEQKRFLLVLFILVSLSVLAVSVSSVDYNLVGSSTGIVEEVVTPVFGTLDIADFYERNSGFIDFILLAIIFIGLAQFGLSKTFARDGEQSPAGKAVAVAVGMALAIAATVGMREYGLTIASFGIVAFAILLILLAVAFYEIALALGVPWYIAFAFAYLLVYFAMSAEGTLFAWLKEHAGIIIGLLNLVKAGCIILALYGFWILFSNALKAMRGTVAPGAEIRSELADTSRRERRELKDERKAINLENEATRLNTEELNLDEIELKDEVAELKDLKILSSIIRELSHVARQIEEEHRRKWL